MIYIFFDLETTGFSSNQDKVIEIAAAAVDMDTEKVIETFQTFIDPGVSIPSKITEITSITDSMVANQPTEQVGFEMFAEFLNKYDFEAIAGHNIKTFDMKWVDLRNERYELGLDFTEVELLDTLVMVRQIAKKGVLVGYDFTTKTGRPSFKLANLMAYFELGTQNHRAIDDVLNNIIVYKKLIALEANDTSLGF